MSAATTCLVILAALAAARPLYAHGGHERSHDMSVVTTITIEEDIFRFIQVQRCWGTLGRLIYRELDLDHDGRVSDAERAGGSRRLAREHVANSDVEVDWQIVDPGPVRAEIHGLGPSVPVSLPESTPIEIHFSGSCPLAPGSPVQLLRLGLASLNAFSIRGEVLAGNPWRIVRSNVGVLEPGGRRLTDAVVVDGRPSALEFLLAREESPDGARRGVPAFVASLVAVLLFGLGLSRVRRSMDDPAPKA